MSLHVVVGAGSTGLTTASLLANAGEQVRLVTRRGIGPDHPGIERVKADATDTGLLRRLTTGAAALYNCANPPYHRWTTDWPPIANAMLAAAESSGAVLVMTGNLYGYGVVNRPMTEDTPLTATTVKGRVRATLWRQALAAHQAGRVRVTEVRSSDYVGPGCQSVVNDFLVKGIVAGRTARVPAALDQPHTVTFIGDAARMLVTAATDARAWGRAWHTPSSPARTMREMAAMLAREAGTGQADLRRMPGWMLWLGGLFSPTARAFREMTYQFDHPFVMDSSRAQEAFGLTPTPLEEAFAVTVRSIREQASRTVGR